MQRKSFSLQALQKPPQQRLQKTEISTEEHEPHGMFNLDGICLV